MQMIYKKLKRKKSISGCKVHQNSEMTVEPKILCGSAVRLADNLI